jgi:hypothetical protein
METQGNERRFRTFLFGVVRESPVQMERRPVCDCDPANVKAPTRRQHSKGREDDSAEEASNRLRRLIAGCSERRTQMLAICIQRMFL